MAKPEKSGKKKHKEEVAVCSKCIVGFAIRVDKGNNAKGGFDKKISEGLTFLREYLDKAACILPSGKDRNAAGDLRMIGCSLFYKKCQEVDTVSKLILLGVSNSIEEDVIKDTLDKVLVELESTLLQTDSKYKLTNDQRQNWIKYAVTREFPPGMPWEDAEEKKKKQGNNNARLAYILQVYQPDYDRISNLCRMAKQRKLWSNHWGNTAYTVEIPENNSQQGEKTRYIQMVQTHGSVQLSLRAASINGVIDMDSKFSLRLTPDRWNPKRTHPDLIKGGLPHDGGERQKGMDMPG